MKIHYATLTILFMSAQTSQAAENLNDGSFFEKNFPSSGKTALIDYDSYYQIPLSPNENIDVVGNVGFDANQLNSSKQQASFLLKYSVKF